MRKEIEITSVAVESNRVILQADQLDFGEIKPKSQMLVDSDRFAFIYIVEIQDEYAYVTLPEPSWAHLKEVCTEHLPVVLRNGEAEIELPAFEEELVYLLDNIKDNANYGDDMVLRVEKAFS
ncbi:MAG: hypothetical protein ACI35R_06880 [Bacillus sp. (in: firmicutes)]